MKGIAIWQSLPYYWDMAEYGLDMVSAGVRLQNIMALLIAAFLGVQSAGTAEILTIQSYLDQVRTGSPDYQASLKRQKGVRLAACYADLAYSPAFIARADVLDERKEGASVLEPLRTQYYDWNLGVAKKFFTGTSISLNYGLSYTKLFPGSIPGFPPALVSELMPSDPYYDAKPSVTLTQSILRDFMSGMTDAGIGKAKAAASAEELAEKYRANALLFEATRAYWSVVLARETVKSAKDSLDRASALVATTEKKVEMNLMEPGDLLQAKANNQARVISLGIAEQSLNDSQRSFNIIRGRHSDKVIEELGQIDSAAESAVKPLERPTGNRLDVQAATEALKAAGFGLKEAGLKLLPDLNIFGTAALNGHNYTAQEAGDAAWTGDRPTYMAGVALTAPLDYSVLLKNRDGYREMKGAASLYVEKYRLAEDEDWESMTTQYKVVTERLTLARNLQELQKAKLEAERERYQSGRSTMFQLLVFEEDYSQSQLAVLRLGYQRLMLEAQAILYGAR